MPSMPNASADRLLGTVVDGWTIEAKLGAGAMGVVYRARRGAQRAALKVALPETLSPDSLERFRREAHMMLGIVHPHVVRCYQAGESGDFVYLSLEYMAGGALQDVLEREGRLSVPQAVAVIRRVLAGLGAVHERGILHRDLKPENVLLDERGCPKLTDFGLARADRHARITGAGMILGTVEYMSPEQTELEDLDPRADLYAAGAMLFHLVAGHPPYGGKSGLGVLQQHRSAPVPSISALVPEAKALERPIKRLMAKRREDRPTTAREALALFDGLDEAPLLAGQPLPPLDARGATATRARPSRLLDLLALLLLAAAGVLLADGARPGGFVPGLAVPPLAHRAAPGVLALGGLLVLQRLWARRARG